MKRFTSFIFILLLLFCVSTIHAQSVGEHIQSFHSDAKINKDGTIDVVETIEYDFASLYRHGIYRDIPNVKVGDGDKKYRLDFTDFKVVDDQGKSYQYSESSLDGGLRLKIGDPNRTITGLHTYVIYYHVSGALGYFSKHDELYWNVTGNGWDVPIDQATATITLPLNIQPTEIQNICYTGYAGSKEQNCTSEVNGNTIKVASNAILPESSGLTYVVGFPKGKVAVLLPKEIVPFEKTWYGKLTIFAFILVAIWWYLLYPIKIMIDWFKKGQDPKATVGVVQANFDPPKTPGGRVMTPGETGTLIDEKADMQDISAMVVNLAQRGYFDIVEKKKKDFYLELKKDYENDQSLLPFEQEFMKTVFAYGDSVRIKDRELYSMVDRIKKDFYDQLVNDKMLPEDPSKIRTFYSVVATIALSTGNILGFVMALVFGLQMPRKTEEGVNAANMAKSLKNFLTSQERQLNFQGKNQMMFEKLLPYAVAFGVEREWAKRFETLKIKEPDWYHGYYAGTYFNVNNFSNSMRSSFSTLQTASTPPSTSSSGFSSGGSSGGGGGGGGGGSW